MVDVLADVLRNSKLDSAAIEGEKKDLLAALEEAEEDHMGVVMDNLHAAAFQGTSLARSPLGNTNGIKVFNCHIVLLYLQYMFICSSLYGFQSIVCCQTIPFSRWTSLPLSSGKLITIVPSEWSSLLSEEWNTVN